MPLFSFPPFFSSSRRTNVMWQIHEDHLACAMYSGREWKVECMVLYSRDTAVLTAFGDCHPLARSGLGCLFGQRTLYITRVSAVWKQRFNPSVLGSLGVLAGALIYTVLAMLFIMCGCEAE